MAALVVCGLLLALEVALCIPVFVGLARKRVTERNRKIARGDMAESQSQPTNAQARLARAGVEMSPAAYAALVGTAGLVLAFAGGVRFGALGVLAGAAATIAASELYLRVRTNSLRGDFEHQLGQALPMIAEGVRVGMTFEQSMGNVADSMEDPFKSNIKQFVRERTYGVSTTVAMDNLANRIKSKDMADLATVVAVQSETGGKLADILDSIALTIQKRERLRRHVASVTADGRLSAAIIAAIPVMLLVVLGLVANDYMSLLFTTPVGWAILGVSAAMVVIGLVIMRKLYNIKIY